MCIFKNKLFAILLIALLAASCTEVVDIHTRGMDRHYLVVEGMLTDRTDMRQKVQLTGSVDYFEPETPPAVSGARVAVSNGESTVEYTETPPGSGCYIGPEGFCGTPGGTYTLTIDVEIDGEQRHYEASSTMEEPGFADAEVDYMYAGKPEMHIDSLWTVALWGRDLPQTSYYYINSRLNDAVFPMQLSLSIDDKYFAGQKVTCFPVTTLAQTGLRQKMYGDCAKYLETGDVFTLYVYTIPKDYYDFYMGFVSSSVGAAIPLIQSQPSNCPTNIRGDYAAGYFVACSSTSASVVIDQPLRPFYKKLLGF